MTAPFLSRARLAALSFALALAACGDGGSSTPSTPGRAVTLQKITGAPNPTGLRFGFYEVETQQAATLQMTSRRTIARAGYEHWASAETTQGQYTFTTDKTIAATHSFGEQVFTSVAISFTADLSGLHSTIPAFYPQDITDPTTRTAAKAYVRAFVQHLLQTFGPVVLAIDNEMVSNWRLDAGDADAAARAATWGAWYLEAAATARQAAADLGMADSLKLVPIVNGDPFAPGNLVGQGPSANAWLVNAVAASDGLAADDYHSDPSQPVTDPTITIDTIAFWIDDYAAGKPFTMTENGFTTITTWHPEITRDQRGDKFTGTEADQAAYFGALMPALQAANAPDGAFHNQLRAFSIFSNVDNPDAPSLDNVYFGLLRLDGSPKAASGVVAQALKGIEATPHDAPWAAAGDPVDVTAQLGSGVQITTTDGDAFELLRYRDTLLPSGTACHLRGTAATGGLALLLNVNGNWSHVGVAGGAFDIKLPSSDCVANGVNVVDIQATGGKFPATNTISNLSLAMQ